MRRIVLLLCGLSLLWLLACGEDSPSALTGPEDQPPVDLTLFDMSGLSISGLSGPTVGQDSSAREAAFQQVRERMCLAVAAGRIDTLVAEDFLVSDTWPPAGALPQEYSRLTIRLVKDNTVPPPWEYWGGTYAFPNTGCDSVKVYRFEWGDENIEYRDCQTQYGVTVIRRDQSRGPTPVGW